MDAASQSILAGVNPELQRRFLNGVTAAEARGVSVQIHSGFRSNAQQIALWNNRASNPNPVARPGTSPHEYGWAIDATPIPRTNAAWSVLWDAMRSAGLALGEDFSTRKDPPHFELPGFQHGAANPLPDSFSQGAFDFGSVLSSSGISMPPVWLLLLVLGVVVVKRIL